MPLVERDLERYFDIYKLSTVSYSVKAVLTTVTWNKFLLRISCLDEFNIFFKKYNRKRNAPVVLLVHKEGERMNFLYNMGISMAFCLEGSSHA